jgi:hypothetical protein
VDRRILPWTILGLLLAGCDAARAPKHPTIAAAPSAAASFDEGTAGVVTGRVIWSGEVPHVWPFLSPANPLSDGWSHNELREWPNPNAPVVDPSGGAGQAVVMLRGIDVKKARSWDLPPVRVVHADYHLQIQQGDAVGRYGFVHRGDMVDFVSNQAVFHAVQARGAAFFALVLPDANQVRRWTLSHSGVVELSSGAGYYWMHGYLFVVDHPYIACTDAQGYFTFDQVPPGKYELVVWHPNWLEASHSRDADTCHICRMTFQPPLEVVRPIEIGPRETRSVDVLLPAPIQRAQFEK